MVLTETQFITTILIGVFGTLILTAAGIFLIMSLNSALRKISTSLDNIKSNSLEGELGPAPPATSFAASEQTPQIVPAQATQVIEPEVMSEPEPEPEPVEPQMTKEDIADIVAAQMAKAMKQMQPKEEPSKKKKGGRPKKKKEEEDDEDDDEFEDL